MDPALTWEILSRLAAAPSGGDPPFFAQREAKERAKQSDASSAADVEAEGVVFVQACPLHDDGCFPALYSRDAICNKFANVLRQYGGRVSSSEMDTWLGMEEEDVMRVGDWLCGRDDGKHSRGGRVCRVFNPATQQHEYALVESIKARLRERIEWHCRGSSADDEHCPSLREMARSGQSGEWSPIATVPTKQLAHDMNLTCEDVARLLEEELSSDASESSAGITVVRSKMGVPVEVHNSRVAERFRHLEGQLSSALLGVTAPSSLAKVLGQESGAEVSAKAIIAAVESLAQMRVVHGTLSIPSNNASLANAIYTPHLYSRAQREIADSFYQSNGYLTEKKCVAVGISRNRIEEFVKESFPDAILLTDSIIDLDTICRPIESALQSALLNKTFADLTTHLPAEIASSEDDVKAIINVHLVALLRDQPQVRDAFVEGLKIFKEDLALFFSKEIVEDCKTLLPPLVEEYSKQRAKAIAKGQTNTAGGEKDLVPLVAVAKAVGEQYPDLLALQNEHGHAANNILWSSDTSNDGPLVEFCRRAMFSSDLERMCARSVKAELGQLDDTRHGVSVSSQAAAKIANIGDSFESSFRTLCHLLQLFSKSVDVISARAPQSINDKSIDQLVGGMKRELLLGCGSCLARLITEYYAFRHEGEVDSGEGSRLFFESYDASTVDQDFQGVNVATINFPRYELKCRSDERGPFPNPMKYLRSAYPGSPGLALSQMWNLCSNNGEDEDKDAGEKLGTFIQLLGEVCLTLVGVPFSILDKKTERKVLAARREGLLDRLERSRDNMEVARCAAILIYQQVKSLPIAGVETANTVTRLFEHDKKIPRKVTEDLLTLQNSDKNDASMSLILQVKRYGSAKNGKTLASLIEDTKKAE